jgi:hypothetical protein
VILKVDPSEACPPTPDINVGLDFEASTLLTRSRPNHGQTGSHPESAGSLWEVATLQSTCLRS